jgi:hypothetical protein
MQKLQVKNWQFPVVGLLGLWFAVSPWVLKLQTTTNLMATSIVLGLALIASAIASVIKPDGAEKWTTAAVGLVTAVSPWLVRFAADPLATHNAEAVGLISLLLAVWVLARDGAFQGLMRDRVAR